MSEIAIRTPTELADWAVSDERVQQYAMALPEGKNAQQFQRAMKTALVSQPDLVKADRGSLYLALLRAAELGVVPDGRQATINVYEDKRAGIQKATLIVMIGGVRDILAEFGWMLQTACVYEHDVFSVDEARQLIEHRRAPLGQERGAIIGAYAQAWHKDGRHMIEVMTVAEINHVRDKSSRAAKNGPWVDWYSRMAEKTPGHRLAKKLPLDPKDRERVELIVAEDLAPGEAAAAVYGPPEDLPALAAAGSQPPAEQDSASPPAGGAPLTSPGTDGSPAESQPPPAGEQKETPSSAGQAGFDDEPGPEPAEADVPSDEAMGDALEALADAAADYVPPNGKYAAGGENGPKTFAEIAALGAQGEKWFAWALPRITDPPEYAAALWSFARVRLPGVYQEAAARRDLGEAT